MPRSIASRLFLSYLAVVVVGLAVASLTISGLILRYEDDQTRLHLQELSAPFLTAIQTGVRAGQPPRDIVDALTEQAHAANARLLLTTAQRRVVIDSDGTLAGTLLPQPTTGNIGEFTEGSDAPLLAAHEHHFYVESSGLIIGPHGFEDHNPAAGARGLRTALQYGNGFAIGPIIQHAS